MDNNLLYLYGSFDLLKEIALTMNTKYRWSEQEGIYARMSFFVC